MPVTARWPPSEVLLYVFVGFGISLTMTERVEQRYCIKFCYKLGDSQSETIRKIQQVWKRCYGGNKLRSGSTDSKMAAHQWKVNSVLRGHKPLGIQLLLRVKNLVRGDRRLTLREIAEEVGISKDSAHEILRADLNMRRVAAKFVPSCCRRNRKNSVLRLHRNCWTLPALILSF